MHLFFKFGFTISEIIMFYSRIFSRYLYLLSKIHFTASYWEWIWGDIKLPLSQRETEDNTLAYTLTSFSDLSQSLDNKLLGEGQ